MNKADFCSVNYEPGPYGPGFNHYFYSHVFELLLRLRANYFWPAEWASMYNVDDTANQPLADAYGIVMGTSHTEPMMRASNEWPKFGAQYGGNGQWEYDTNNQSLIPFFKYGAQRAKPYQQNSLVTIAMVGILLYRILKSGPVHRFGKLEPIINGVANANLERKW
jgi:hypothetical protein